MTKQLELAQGAGSAFAFPDLVELGFEALLDVPATQIAAIASRIEHQGFVDRAAKAKKAELHAVLRVPVRVREEADYVVRVELYFDTSSEGRIRIGNRSTIAFNCLHLLRLMVGWNNEVVGLDGKTNMAGATMTHPVGLVRELTTTIGNVVEQVILAIASLMPSDFVTEHQAMWLRKAELAHDAECSDPVSVTHILGRSSLPAAIGSISDIYRQTHSCLGEVPVVRWLVTKSGIFLKVYAKADGLLRHEVSCLSRGSVVAMIGRDWTHIEGGEAAGLVQSFMDAATPRLKDLVRHVEGVSSTGVRPAVLLFELGSLVELILSQGSWAAEAQAAWDSLVLTGRYDAKGLRKGTVLRDLLEGLVGPDGPLLHGARPTLYHLHPRLVQRNGS